MTPERFRKVDELVLQALDRPKHERAEFIRAACAGEEDLRIEVESLLAWNENKDGFFVEAPARLAAQFLAEGQPITASAASTSCPTMPSEDGATLPWVDAPEELLKPGSPLGRYVVRKRLGRGGMGVVYLADDPELNRKIAIKLMRPGAWRNSSASEGRARLMREAQAMAQLSHPNLIAVYDVGTFGDQVFIAMEYVEGSTLTQWLADQQRPWREIVNMFVQTGRGLAGAHAAGILHRDFKPDNVLVGKDGRPRVLDFGLARALFGEPEKSAPGDEPPKADATSSSNLAPLGAVLTEPGRLMGTPAYMAPEQLLGQGADHRTDQYSFCVALYQALYGELPFKGQSIEALVREMGHGKAPEAPPGQVPSRLQRVVLKGLRPEPAGRYPSMDALLDELLLQATRTRRRLLAVVILAMVGAIAAVGGIAWKKRNAAPPSIQSIAILPLRNLGDASDEATIDGLSNGLTTTVAQLSNATIISQNSAARYKTSSKNLQEIASELGVDAIVSGFVQRFGRRIQVVMQLTQVASSRQLWTRTFENESTQLPVLQADIAAALLVEVDSRRTTPEQEARLAKLRSVKPEVYDACLKGWLKVGTEKSIADYQEAIREDPNYAPAYVGLADAYIALSTKLTSREASPLATEALMKALSLDPKLGEAHATLSWVKLNYEWDLQAAEKEAKLAIALSPNDANAHNTYTNVLMALHRLDEALAETKRALRLDPLSSMARAHIAWYFAAKKEYDRAIQEWRNIIELQPSNHFLHRALAATYHAAGRYAEALAEAQRGFELSGAPLPRAQIAHMLAHLGKTDEAEKIIEELKEGGKSAVLGSWNIAATYAVLKRKEETFKWLEYALEARAFGGGSNYVKEEDFGWLRSDPRFQDLVKRIPFQSR